MTCAQQRPYFTCSRISGFRLSATRKLFFVIIFRWMIPQVKVQGAVLPMHRMASVFMGRPPPGLRRGVVGSGPFTAFFEVDNGINGWGGVLMRENNIAPSLNLEEATLGDISGLSRRFRQE